MSEVGATQPAAGAAPGSTSQAVEPAVATLPKAGGQAQLAAPAASQQAAAAPPPQSPAVSLAASLAQVVEGTRLRGVIIGAGADNRPLLRTDSGTFVLDTREPLPPNTELTLRILSTATAIRAALVARNGTPIHPPRELTLTLKGVKAALPPPPGGAPAAASAVTSGMPPAALRPGVQVMAVVLGEPPGPVAPASTAAGASLPGRLGTALAPGTTLLLRTVSGTSGISGTPAAAPAAGAGGAGTSPPVAGQAAPGQATLSQIPPIQATPSQVTAFRLGAVDAATRPAVASPGAAATAQGTTQDSAPARAAARVPTPATTAATAKAQPPARPAPGPTLPGSPPGGASRTPSASANRAPSGAATVRVSGPGVTPPAAAATRGAATAPAAVTATRAAPVAASAATPGAAPVTATVTAAVAATPLSTVAAAAAVAAAPTAASLAAPGLVAAAGAPPGEFVAIAMGPGLDGRLLMRTPLGPMALETSGPVVKGAQLSFQVLASRPPTAGSAAGGVAQGALPVLAREWPALKEALEILANIDPAVARHLVGSRIPTPTARLPAAVLFFLAAMRLGDVSGWLGREASQILERSGRARLLRQLGDDFARIGRFAEEPARGEWRTFVLPFHDGRELHQVWLLSRQQRRDEDGEEGEDGEVEGATRFVVELELSRLGPLQLDGLVRRSRFDLIVRTTVPLAGDMRRDILGIFNDGIAASGLEGAVIFRAEPAFPLSVADEVARRHGGSDDIVV